MTAPQPPMSPPQQQPQPQFFPPRAGDGWRWLTGGFKLFWRNPWALSSAALIFLMLPMFVGVLPTVGGPLSLLLLPGLAAGAMYAAFSVSQGTHPLPHTIFAPFMWGPQRQNLPRLRATLVLGAAYALLALAIMAGLRWGGGEALGELMRMAQNQSQEGQQSLDLQAMQALLQEAPHVSLLLLASVPLLGSVFFVFSRAAMLSFCFNLNPSKALFFSAYSCLKSLPALLLYGLALGVFSALAAQLMLLHAFLYAVGLIVFVGVFLCSLWVGFGSSFPPPVLGQRGPAAPADGDDKPDDGDDSRP